MSAVFSSVSAEEDPEARRRLRQPVDLGLQGDDLVAGLPQGRASRSLLDAVVRASCRASASRRSSTAMSWGWDASRSRSRSSSLARAH